MGFGVVDSTSFMGFFGGWSFDGEK